MTFKQILRQRAKKSSTAKMLSDSRNTPYHVIIAPLMTEKAYKDSEGEGAHKYTFKVHADANKIDVKEAINLIYHVTPVAVNVSRVKEKGRSNRKLVRRSYKKAVIALKAGESLPTLD